MGTSKHSAGNQEDRRKAVESFAADLSARRTSEFKKQLAEQDERIFNLTEELAKALEDAAEANRILKAFDTFQSINVRTEPIKAFKVKGVSESVAVANLGDVHAYETVKKEEVGEVNEYNPTICRESLRNFFRGVVRNIETCRTGSNISRLVLNLLGDEVTNVLHDDQADTNAGTLPEEVLFVYKEILSGLDFLLENGKLDEIRVICVSGNHDRDCIKPRSKRRGKHAWTWLIGHLLAMHYAGVQESRIKFEIEEGYHHYLEVFGRTIRIHHGDGIKYEGGIGGITIPVLKKLKQWDKARRADLDIFGHWHTSIMHPSFLANGTIMGYSEFSVKCGTDFERPQQSFILLHPDRWLTAYIPIYVR